MKKDFVFFNQLFSKIVFNCSNCPKAIYCTEFKKSIQVLNHLRHIYKTTTIKTDYMPIDTLIN